MINWIIQKNLTKVEVLSRIKSAIEQDGECVELIEVIPFSTELPAINKQADHYIFYGSTTLMLNAYRSEEYKKGVFYNPKTFHMAHYAKVWEGYMLNGGGHLLDLASLLTWESEADKDWFIRPNHDSKEFSGKVAPFSELQAWVKRIIPLEIPELNKDTEVWLAEPKAIRKEWRLFMVDDEIISASLYMQNGELNKSESDIPLEMLEFAKKRMDEHRLADAYVMDIALSEGEYKIIECNCLNATGFYAHDIDAIVKALNKMLRKDN